MTIEGRPGPAVAICAALIAALGSAAAAAPLQAPNEATVRIAFVGDSTGDGLWGGFASLASRDGCLKDNIELGRFARNSTGLTRPERFNWVDEMRRIGDAFRPRLFVMSLGLNDRQSVVEHGKVTLENSPDYPAKYKERVTAVLRSAAASKAAVLWVGLAAMREAGADRDAREKNRYFRDAIAEFADPGIQFVEPWKLAHAGEDKFASYGPDPKGKMIQIRSSDGEHFTSAGDSLVAAYLLPKMVATLLRGGARLGEACAGTAVPTE